MRMLLNILICADYFLAFISQGMLAFALAALVGSATAAVMGGTHDETLQTIGITSAYH